MVFLQHGAELGGDSLWEENGDAGADTDVLDMGNGVQSGEDFLESGIREEQGVTAGDEDIADLWCFFQILECSFPLCLEFLVGGTGDDSAAGAVAAVGGAAVSNEE